MADTQPLVVTFSIEEGQVWVDPGKVAWTVVAHQGDTIYLERSVSQTVQALDLVRSWNKINDDVSNEIGTGS